MTWLLRLLLALGLSLGSGGEGMALTAQQAAQVAYQAGFRGEDLVKAVAIAGRESRYDPAARRTDNPGGPQAGTGDFGLFQINYSNYPELKQALGLSSINDLLDPVTNARAAFYLYQRSGFAPWAAGPGGFTAGGDPLHGTDMTAARSAVDQATRSGTLTNTYESAGPTGGPGAATAGGKFDLPSDAKVYKLGNATYVVFDLGGVNLSYRVNMADVTFPASKVQSVTADQWRAFKVVNGGNAEELRDLKTTWGSFGAFWNSIMDTVLGKNNPARNDASVLRVIATYAGRPDMSSQELNNLLQGTDWYQKHTQDQLAWNSLSEAERTKRTNDTAAQMVNTWFQFTGQSVSITDPVIRANLEAVASGKMGIGAWTQTVVKPAALKITNSPWNRQISDEQKAQRQPIIDQENTAQSIKELARRWGVQWTDKTINDWAMKVTDKRASDADVLKALQTQAQVLFPWKDINIDTESAAAPWVQTYNRVMERDSDHMDPKIQQAMSANMSIWDFEKSLKKSAEWTGTKNAREEMMGMASEIGRRMGFVTA